MSRTLKTYTPTPRTIIDTVTCDLCGTTTADSGWGEHRERNSYGAITNDVEVKWRHSYGYSDGGGGTEYVFDICPKCFKERLIPWVVSQGGKPTINDLDW